MSRREEEQIERLCQREETRKKALMLLREAKVKTTPGSGHSIGPHSVGLLAICAFIASQKLINDDCNRKVAQMASCLKPKDFDKTLDIVEAALAKPHDASPTKSGLESRSRSPTKKSTKSSSRSPVKPPPQAIAKTVVEQSGYEALKGVFNVDEGMDEVLVEWAEEVEVAFTSASENKFSGKGNVTLVKFAIMSWTCSQIPFPRNRVGGESVETSLKLSQRTIDKIYAILDEHCEELAKRMAKDAKKLKRELSKRVSRSTTQSPTKSILKDTTSPKKRGRQPNVAFSENSEDDEAAEAEALLLDSPLNKRRKMAAPQKAGASTTAFDAILASTPQKKKRVDIEMADADERLPPFEDLTLFTTAKSSTNNTPTSSPSKSRVKQPVEVGTDSEEDEDDVMPTRRKFHPVFYDQVQWNACDPRLEKEWKRATEHARGMGKLYGWPVGVEL